VAHESYELARLRDFLQLIGGERLAKLVLHVHHDVDLRERVPALVA